MIRRRHYLGSPTLPLTVTVALFLTALCHQAQITFEELAAHARDTTKLLDVGSWLKCTKCGPQNADLQPDWPQAAGSRVSTWGTLPPDEV